MYTLGRIAKKKRKENVRQNWKLAYIGKPDTQISHETIFYVVI